MQTYKMYSIRDSKTEIFSYPFNAKTHGEAERNFSMLVNDKRPENLVNQFPQDYDLWYVADFDDQSGKIIPAETPVHIVKAVQFLSKIAAVQ